MIMDLPMIRLDNGKIAPINLIHLVEFVSELVLPLASKARGRDNQHSPSLVFALQGRKEKPDLDGLAKPNVVGNQPVVVAGTQDTMDKLDLVGQRLHVKSVQ